MTEATDKRGPPPDEGSAAMSADQPDTRPVCEIFQLLIELATLEGVVPISSLPFCWERTFDGWFIAVNGHDVVQTSNFGGEVPPFHCYIQWKGIPVGLVNPLEGAMLHRAGRVAEDDFIAALRTEIERVTPGCP